MVRDVSPLVSIEILNLKLVDVLNNFLKLVYIKKIKLY
jgi:hypothetical protein